MGPGFRFEKRKGEGVLLRVSGLKGAMIEGLWFMV